MVTTKFQNGSDQAVPVVDPRTPEGYFAGCPEGMAVYRTVRELLSGLGPVDVRVSRSHIGFVRDRGFGYLWRPGRWLRRPSAGVVLSFVLDHPLAAARIKEVVHPTRKVWIHHVELHGPADVDAEITGWLAEAYRQAPPRQPGRRGRRADHPRPASSAESVNVAGGVPVVQSPATTPTMPQLRSQPTRSGAATKDLRPGPHRHTWVG